MQYLNQGFQTQIDSGAAWDMKASLAGRIDKDNFLTLNFNFKNLWKKLPNCLIFQKNLNFSDGGGPRVWEPWSKEWGCLQWPLINPRRDEACNKRRLKLASKLEMFKIEVPVFSKSNLKFQKFFQLEKCHLHWRQFRSVDNSNKRYEHIGSEVKFSFPQVQFWQAPDTVLYKTVNDKIQFFCDNCKTVTFEDVTFKYVTFKYVTFEDVTFTDGSFKYVTFKDVTFKDVTFKDVTFEDVTFEDVTFKDVTFEDVTFDDVTFEDVTFEDVTFDDVTKSFSI